MNKEFVRRGRTIEMIVADQYLRRVMGTDSTWDPTGKSEGFGSNPSRR